MNYVSRVSNYEVRITKYENFVHRNSSFDIRTSFFCTSSLWQYYKKTLYLLRSLSIIRICILLSTETKWANARLR